MPPPRPATGRLPHDPARVAAAPRHAFSGRSVPAVLDRRRLPFTPGLYRNDVLPDCAAAGLANDLAAACAVGGGFAPAIRPDLVVAFYADVAGLPPGAPDAAIEATPGVVLQDALAAAAEGAYLDEQGVPYFPTHEAVAVGDRGLLAHSLLDGAGYWGVTLRERDFADFAAGRGWDDDGSDPGGVAGGHCAVAWDYLGLGDADAVRIATWGVLQVATWRWVAARLEEAWAIDWNFPFAT